MQRLHTDSSYESELTKLREAVLVMGAKSEDLLRKGMSVLASRDVREAKRLIELDRGIDELEVKIDEQALSILARRQPVAGDLRMIAAVFKMVTDLERVGDLAVNICERALELSTAPPLPEQSRVIALGDHVAKMLHDALDAFVHGDVDVARDVLSRDRVVDETFSSIFHDLVASMVADRECVERATSLQSLARYLERVADHSTNIAEKVVFMVHGKDVRHMGRP